MTSTEIILARLRSLFEERAAAWQRMGHCEPVEITLTASFPVAALRDALTPPPPRNLTQLHADIDHHLQEILNLLKPGGKS